MLISLTTHPIQYQVPLWRAIATDGRVPLEVWYMSDHATRKSQDSEFGNSFAWDLDMLSGYDYEFINSPLSPNPARFRDCRLPRGFTQRLLNRKPKALWIHGWQVLGYWQSVISAKRAGAKVLLRGESNLLQARQSLPKRLAKKLLLTWFFKHVDAFLYIGTQNRSFYKQFGIEDSRLTPALYCVDNERFAAQVAEQRTNRLQIRHNWGIDEDSICILFCGKFIPKKRPLDLVAAATLLLQTSSKKFHLLFTGSGELGPQIRNLCDISFDVENPDHRPHATKTPRASFTGFLNQNEISQAYAAADCLVLPSDYGETWGLVVNEAMASGLPCLISDRCGCASDLGQLARNSVFGTGNIESLASLLSNLTPNNDLRVAQEAIDTHSHLHVSRAISQLVETM